MNEEDTSKESIGDQPEKVLDFSDDFSHELTTVSRKHYSGLWGFIKGLMNFNVFAKALVGVNEELVYSKYVIVTFQIVDYCLLLYTPIIFLYAMRNNLPISETWIIESFLQKPDT